MRREATIDAIEEAIAAHHVDSIPLDLIEPLDAKATQFITLYGYFDGTEVQRNADTGIDLGVYEISGADDHYLVRFGRYGEEHSYIVNPDDIHAFTERLADIQDVVVRRSR